MLRLWRLQREVQRELQSEVAVWGVIKQARLQEQEMDFCHCLCLRRLGFQKFSNERLWL